MSEELPPCPFCKQTKTLQDHGDQIECLKCRCKVSREIWFKLPKSVTLIGLDYEALDELWKQGVHNKAHSLLHGTQDLAGAFASLVPRDAFVFDRFNLVERQIALVHSELRRLTEYISKLYSYWPPKKKEEIPEKEVLCAKCRSRMVQAGPVDWICPECGLSGNCA